MSFITQVQLACPRVPGTVQCLGTKQADENCLLLTIRRTRSPLKQHPRGQAVWVQTPRGATHMDMYCLNTHDTQHRPHLWCGGGAGSFLTDCVCIYVNVFVCEREKKRKLPSDRNLWNSAVFFYYPGRLNDGLSQEHLCPVVISMVVDPLSVLHQCPASIMVKIFRRHSADVRMYIYALYTSHCF